MSYFMTLTLQAVGWIMLGLGAVLITRPSRIGLLLSGAVEWWRLASFAAFALVLGFSAAALNDWAKGRKRRR